MVLLKVSVLYSHPPWQLPVRSPLSRVTAPLWFKATMQDSLGWLSKAVGKLKFVEAGVSAEGHEERHRWGGTAPVKMETSMWNARKIWGRQIHMYKIFWNFPKPPIRQRISSKFISEDAWRCLRLCPRSGLNRRCSWNGAAKDALADKSCEPSVSQMS